MAVPPLRQQKDERGGLAPLLVNDETPAGDLVDVVLLAVGVTTDEATQVAIDLRRHDAAGVVVADDEGVLITPVQQRAFAVDLDQRALADLEAEGHVHDEHWTIP